jgi:hypothetical protein
VLLAVGLEVEAVLLAVGLAGDAPARDTLFFKGSFPPDGGD